MRFLILSSMVCSSASVQAQNFVPNGSFEEYTECPDYQAQVERAVGWTRNSASPDYFNRCDISGYVGVPLNLAGYQEAYDGDGYMGCITYLDGAPTYRECIQHALSSPLMPGIPVFISMMVSPGGFGNDPIQNSLKYASNGIGVKFSMGPHPNYLYWPGNVALYMTDILSDTTTWVQLSGVYMPDSAYAYLSIGCFLPYDDIQTQVIDPSAVTLAAYSFIDNVCVSTNAKDCPLTIGIDEVRAPIRNLGSNPFGRELYIRLDGELTRISYLVLMDEVGRTCQQVQLADGTTDFTWFLPALPSGSYFLQLRNFLGRYRPIHIVHINP